MKIGPYAIVFSDWEATIIVAFLPSSAATARNKSIGMAIAAADRIKGFRFEFLPLFIVAINFLQFFAIFFTLFLLKISNLNFWE